MDLKFKRCGTIHNLQLKIGRYGNGSLEILKLTMWFQAMLFQHL